jgi:co-chaperonin GroES (HSP10)
MKIIPFGKNLLIEPNEKKQTLVSDTKSLCEYGTVIEVGDEVEKIQKGDMVGYLVWGINSLEIDGKKYYFVPEDDQFLLGKLEL